MYDWATLSFLRNVSTRSKTSAKNQKDVHERSPSDIHDVNQNADTESLDQAAVMLKKIPSSHLSSINNAEESVPEGNQQPSGSVMLQRHHTPSWQELKTSVSHPWHALRWLSTRTEESISSVKRNLLHSEISYQWLSQRLVNLAKLQKKINNESHPQNGSVCSSSMLNWILKMRK